MREQLPLGTGCFYFSTATSLLNWSLSPAITFKEGIKYCQFDYPFSDGDKSCTRAEWNRADNCSAHHPAVNEDQVCPLFPKHWKVL